MNVSMRRQIAIFTALLLFGGAQTMAEPVAGGLTTILSTDLSLGKDADDWFDTFVFIRLNSSRPCAIVLEHYATDDVLAKTREFLDILGHTDVRVAKGIQEELSGSRECPKHGPCGDGAELILETMRTATGKVRLIAVGSLRNEAIAYRRDPDLFLRKIEKLYFAGGNLTGQRECNVNRDVLAADIIINSPIPKVWIPCAPELKQKLTAADERRIAETPSQAAAFLTGMLASWRQARGHAFLERTEQLPPEGKNLWSLPAFLHAQGEGDDWLTFVPGKMAFDPKKWTWFTENDGGPDLMLKTCSQRQVCEWMVELIRTR